jgi:hypothetical protein
MPAENEIRHAATIVSSWGSLERRGAAALEVAEPVGAEGGVGGHVGAGAGGQPCGWFGAGGQP